MDFAELSDRAQVNRLRSVALAALKRYPIEPVRLRLLEHGFNTTFRVDTSSGDKFALRIDVNRRKSLAALDAEMAWLAALTSDTDIVVPTPQPTTAGRLHTAVRFDELDTDLNAAVMSWLPGRDLESPTVESLFELGRITAGLHAHAATWTPPPEAGFPAIDGVLLDAPDRIHHEHPLVSPEQRRVLCEAFEHVESLHDAMVAADRPIPIHADLHGLNVKWMRGRMSVFDFDDAGLGVRAQDLAITSYYQRPEPELRQALFDGYQAESPLPPFTSGQFEATLAARALVLVNEVIAINTAEIRAMAPRFVENTVLRLRVYLATGVFERDVPGVKSLS